VKQSVSKSKVFKKKPDEWVEKKKKDSLTFDFFFGTQLTAGLKSLQKPNSAATSMLSIEMGGK